MRMLSVLALLGAGLLVAPANAEEKKDKPLAGTFIRKAGDVELKIVFKKDNVMDFHATIGETSCIMTSKYTKEKDGTLMCEITNFETKGDFPAKREKGDKFSVKVETKDKKVVLSELKGDEINDEQKQLVEGDYEMKAGD